MTATQQELLPPDHTSLQRHRLGKYDRTNPERIYAAAWKRANRRSAGVNQGHSYVEWILCADGKQPTPISRRDAAVAASVIQWLGTNVGLGFILEAERKIDQSRRSDDERRRRPSLREAQRVVRPSRRLRLRHG
ncbi:hypothetical protein LCGC14_0795420 [marine sediment metagenome]|uniref:Uncharacterized protein n=1 Tax=marine sediment metagenome TaxID=412755 RepID=A0A0F9SYG6_9ZZZZ